MNNDNKINVVVIGGIRTHYIKIKALQFMISQLNIEHLYGMDIKYIDAGQHYDYSLSGMFIDELNIHFDYRFKYNSKKHTDIIGEMFVKIGDTLDELKQCEEVDYVIIMGDVATTAVAALATIIRGIKLVHIESGGRIERAKGGEELFRVIADHTADLCFAATQDDYDNLCHDNLSEYAVFSGDIIYDFFCNIKDSLRTDYFEVLINDSKCKYNIESEYVLASIHHKENLSPEFLQNFFDALNTLKYNTVFITHPNVKRIIINNKIDVGNICMVDGISYIENLIAINNAKFIVTDSGGIQREAYYLDKRCIVRSDAIVWTSILKTGSNIQIGNEHDEIIEGLKWADVNSQLSISYDDIFGTGNSVEIIFKALYNNYNEEK